MRDALRTIGRLECECGARKLGVGSKVHNELATSVCLDHCWHSTATINLFICWHDAIIMFIKSIWGLTGVLPSNLHRKYYPHKADGLDDLDPVIEYFRMYDTTGQVSHAELSHPKSDYFLFWQKFEGSAPVTEHSREPTTQYRDNQLGLWIGLTLNTASQPTSNSYYIERGLRRVVRSVCPLCLCQLLSWENCNLD